MRDTLNGLRVLKYPENQHPVVWSIAGSDNCARAGIQADLLTFQDLGARGRTAVTSVTAQNHKSTQAVYPVEPEVLASQLDALCQECKPQAIKLGLLGSVELARLLRKRLSHLNVPIVCDPVMRAGTGDSLMNPEDAICAIRELLPLCAVVTPNIEEACALSGRHIEKPADTIEVVKILCDLGAESVLVKGGHANYEHGYCWDYWGNGESGFWMRMPRKLGNYRGTGCSLSSALAVAMVNGWSIALDYERRLYDALVIARAYVQQGIRRATSMGTDAVTHGDVSWHLDDLPEIYMRCPAPSLYHIPKWSGTLATLYPIVDDSHWVKKLLHANVDTVQLRIKGESLSADILETQVADACMYAQRKAARLFINDHWRLAIKYRSYGVHLGQSDLEDADLESLAVHGLRVGISTHGWWEIARALCIQPSYIAFGPVFATDSKVMPFAPMGLNNLGFWSEITRNTCVRIAIGGIGLDNIHAVIGSGIDGIAVISAISAQKDWRQAVDLLQAAFKAAQA